MDKLIITITIEDEEYIKAFKDDTEEKISKEFLKDIYLYVPLGTKCEAERK